MFQNRFILVFIISISVQFCYGKNGFERDLIQCVSLVYQYKFNTADSAIGALKKRYPDNAEVHIAEANFLWWRIISGYDNHQLRKQYEVSLNSAYEILKTKGKGCDVDCQYGYINIYSFKARLDGLNKNYFKALGHINSSMDMLKKTFGKEKDYPYFYLTSGLYNYYVATSNSSYPFLMPYLALFPKADKSKGMDYLKIAATHENSILSTEGHYFLMKILMEEGKPESSQKYCEVLTNRYPTNLLFLYYEFKNYLNSGKKELALASLQKIYSARYRNTQISEISVDHFRRQAQNDLKEFYLAREKKARQD